MLGQPVDRDRVDERAGHGLVDEDRLAGTEHRQHLLEVRPAVVGLQQHRVDRSDERADVLDDHHAHPSHLFRIFRHTGYAAFDVGAALRIGMCDPAPGHVLRRFLVVERLSKGLTV